MSRSRTGRDAPLVARLGRVRPRDAATLILYRRGSDGVRVLMGQRHSKHVFMPDKFVFPGGRVDPADARVRPLTALVPSNPG